MNYSFLFDKLSEHKVHYVICGGVAVNLHGIPRMTADIDIILDLNSANIQNFKKAADDLKYKLSVPLSLDELTDEKRRTDIVKDKNLIALSFYNYDKNYLALDVLIDFPILFADLWEEKEIRKNNGTEIFLVSLNHLIKLKEYSNRIQDQQDVYFLSKMKNEKD